MPHPLRTLRSFASFAVGTALVVVTVVVGAAATAAPLP